jgi:hypothetical protein
MEPRAARGRSGVLFPTRAHEAWLPSVQANVRGRSRRGKTPRRDLACVRACMRARYLEPRLPLPRAATERLASRIKNLLIRFRGGA